VSTAGNRALLVTYAWPEGSVRYNKVARFVREFFGKIDQFHDGGKPGASAGKSGTAEVPSAAKRYTIATGRRRPGCVVC
jgi:hypothetical protein